LNEFCPVTGDTFNLENHHIVRRSFGPGFRDAYWVELPDGTIVGNRVNLSSPAHKRITENRARISYEDGLFYWCEGGEKILLKWQPPKQDAWYPQTEEQEKALTEALVSGKAYFLGVEPGQECKLCKRRVPHPKKETSPKSKVFSVRIPIDDAETFCELVDAAAEHHGLKSKPYHSYWILLYGVTLLLQAEKGELPA
jgi:hypothetical protein